jgi:predicted RNA-binding protein YlqC (UPF0109 family)
MSETTIDQQFVEYVVKSLVGNPDDVIVERTVDEKGVLLLLTVNPEDLGRVIGKRGATAQSLRTLLRALGTKQEARFNLKIVDNGEPKPEREDRNGDAGSAWASTPSNSSDDTTYSSSNDDGKDDVAEKNASDDSGEEESQESAIQRTRRELEDLDDLDV